MISGNLGEGIDISGSGATSNFVAGNLIGTNAAGTAAVANYAGVEIDSGASGNLVGSSGAGAGDAAERNIISGNSFAGVWITGTGTDSNAVAGNYIGTDLTGMIALANATLFVFEGEGDVNSDVLIDDGASDNLIGTSGKSADDAGQRNVISASGYDGVNIAGSGSDGNVVAGNFIGTNAAGTAGLETPLAMVSS